LPQEVSLSGRIQESFLRRVEALPEATSLLTLIAAAEPLGDPALMWRAAARLELSADADVFAEVEELLKINGHVVIRHPLVRSAVYGAASVSDRQKVHAVLAAVTDPDLDPDRRAWHLAHAAIGPDEDVAVELERSAARAQRRGGLAATAAFLERAVRLSAEPESRARRAFAAAQAKYLAGAPDAARRLLMIAEAGPLRDGPVGRRIVRRAVRTAHGDRARSRGALGAADRADDPHRRHGVHRPAHRRRRAHRGAADTHRRHRDPGSGVWPAVRRRLAGPGGGGLGRYQHRDPGVHLDRRGRGAGVRRLRARAVLCNGLGRYEDALIAATATNAFAVEGVTIYTQGLAELIEAAARAGATERAADALARLTQMTEASGTDWAAGVRARSQALLSHDESAETFYRAAIERLGRTSIRPQLARARLVYGEWLRRQNRRVDARRELLQAYEMFTDMGMDAFSERTRRELAAAGQQVRRRAVETAHDLTNQETQIAKLAREGLTNQEIGFQLYLSGRTVEWHLRKVFTKLGITSRRQLQTAAL
jgi:DNA-binding CsgD family transcriptional regulator